MAELIWMADINSECTTQTRVMACQDTIDSYADAMRDGVEFPPIEVYFDGETYWIADGWHRFWASLAAGLEEIEALVHQGTEMDALEAGCGANATHGLRRTNADKRHAVAICIERLGYAEKSDRVIADKCAVSPTTVARVRKELERGKSVEPPQVESTVQLGQLDGEDPEDSELEEEPPKRVGKDGKARKAPEKSVVDEILDEPDTLETLAEPTEQVRLNLIQTKKDLKSMCEWHPYIAAAFSSMARNLDEVAGAVRQNTAEVWCPRCDAKGCDRCNNVGWLTIYAKKQQER